MHQGLRGTHFCEGFGRSCGKLCSSLHAVLVAQVIYIQQSGPYLLEHDWYFGYWTTGVNLNLVSVVSGLLVVVLFLEAMIGMGHSST
jgi:hypothetical protein